ncbi:autotransporter outer membrane beta-barrel domain-containing protein, partial [Campylobacter jejuni]
PFNSKKIVLSLATISFLASYANATTSGTCPTSTRSSSDSTNGTYNCTISGTHNQGITLSSSGTLNVTITKNGTLGNTHSISSLVLKPDNGSTPTLTLINEGTIGSRIDIENNNGFQGTITVKTFENKGGTINERVYMGGDGQGTISIENFNNSGTIKGAEQNDQNKNESRQGVWFKGNVTINTFHNTGTIKGGHNGQGVKFEGNVHVGTFHNKQNGTIESKNGNYAILLIGEKSNTPTLENFKNEGFIKGDIGIGGTSGFNGTITVKTFENKNGGTIDGGIYMPASEKGTISIDSFTNTGTIKGGNYQGVYFQGDNVHIKTFENTGFISGSGDDSTNGRFLTGGGVSMSGGTIDAFKNSGTIESTGTKKEHNPAGVKLTYTKVNTFENKGTVSGTIGVIATQGTIGNFINKGIIASTSGAAIQIQTSLDDPSTITNFTNEGTIKSASDGVWIESGNQIGTLTNKGTIESKSNGISFFDYGGNTSPDNTHLGKIILEPGSSIKAGKNGIDIDHQTARSIKVAGIEVQEGASVSGDEAGIYLGKDKEITAPITISGTVSGGNAGIVNEGRMARGIVHNGEDDLVISNQGLVGKDD